MLSTWFRDYLYIPLGGNSGSVGRASFNILVVFGVSGFSHGANWTYLIWGLLRGVYRVAFRVLAPALAALQEACVPFVSQRVGRVTTFASFCVAWTYFGAPDVPTAFDIAHRLRLPTVRPFWDWALAPGLVALGLLITFEALPNALMGAIAVELRVVSSDGGGGVTELMDRCGLRQWVVPQEGFESRLAGHVSLALDEPVKTWSQSSARIREFAGSESVANQYWSISRLEQ